MQKKQLFLVAILLLAHFFIRVHHLLELDPYMDEGFHISRAAMVYEFEQNPGRFAHGKLGLYFWLGLFETDRQHVLFPSRAAMALFSLITVSALYLIGRLLHNHRTGLLVMVLYAVMPYVSFFDRMALADPLASGLATLVVWRSLVFAKRPTLREGVIIGVLLGLATLAKLTTGLMPLLPVFAAIIYYRWLPSENLQQHIPDWLKIYIPPLVVAAVVVILLWSPFVIPAYLARNSDEPFVIVHEQNVSDLGEKSLSERIDYMQRVVLIVPEFVGEHILWLVPAAVLIWLVVGRPFGRELRNTIYLGSWFLLATMLTAATATIPTTRYFSPTMPPLLMILAYVITALWERGLYSKLISASMVVVLLFWGRDFAAPFTTTMWRDYQDLKFENRNNNWTEYHAGYLMADQAAQDAAAKLNTIEPTPQHVYATWWICPMLYFYTDMEVTCFNQKVSYAGTGTELRKALADGESAYLVFSGYTPFFQNIEGLEDEVIGQYDRPNIKWDASRGEVWNVWIYRVWWSDEGS